MQGDLGHARNQYENAHATYIALNDPFGLASYWQNMAVLASFERNNQRALESLLEALQVAEASGDRELGYIYMNMADVYRRLEIFDSARDCAEKGRRYFQDHRDRPGEGKYLTVLGMITIDSGNADQGLQYLEGALQICEEMGDAQMIAQLTNISGRIYGKMGRPEASYQSLKRAEQMYRAMGNVYGLASTMEDVAEYHLNAGEPGRARAALERARELYTKMGLLSR
jgi:tetratricopeptide (TPR) repeat protein